MTVTVIGPPVVRTSDDCSDVAIGLEKLGTAVATGVGKAAQLADFITEDDHRAMSDCSDKSATTRCDFVGCPHAHPRRAEDAVLFEAVEGVVGVRLGWERSCFTNRRACAGPGTLGRPILWVRHHERLGLCCLDRQES